MICCRCEKEAKPNYMGYCLTCYGISPEEWARYEAKRHALMNGYRLEEEPMPTREEWNDYDAGVPTYTSSGANVVTTGTARTPSLCQCSNCKPKPVPQAPQPRQINLVLTRFDNGWTIEATTYSADIDDWEGKVRLKRLVHPAESVFDAVQQALSQALFPAPDNGKQDAE